MDLGRQGIVECRISFKNQMDDSAKVRWILEERRSIYLCSRKKAIYIPLEASVKTVLDVYPEEVHHFY